MIKLDLMAMLPLIVLAITILLVMLKIAIRRNHASTVILSKLGLLTALISLPTAYAWIPRHINSLLVIDSYALFYMALILVSTFVVVALSYGYWEQQSEQKEEYYLLILLAAFGSMVLVASRHFVSLILGLEILSVALYALVAYRRSHKTSLEAGLKYLILAAASSGFLLFGMALVYAQFGTMVFEELAVALRQPESTRSLLFLVGSGLMITGIGFKLAVVPFHMWTPDVYEGAPAPVTAFVATVSKGGMFALVLRYFRNIQADELFPLWGIFCLIAILSMFAGNLLALRQNHVKRILAYSSIAHLGYVMVAFLAGGSLASEAVAYYLVSYFATSLGAFGVVTVLSQGEKEPGTLEDYQGLYWRRPFLAAVMTAMLLSLAGIPLTAGFIGKYLVLSAGVETAQWMLVTFLIFNSVIGLFYYLRIVVAMFSEAKEGEAAMVSPYGTVMLGFLMIGVIFLGVYPAPLMRIIQQTVALF